MDLSFEGMILCDKIFILKFPIFVCLRVFEIIKESMIDPLKFFDSLTQIFDMFLKQRHFDFIAFTQTTSH